ncbi:MAG: hypothetical protein LBS91_08950 [Clostridiales Family XIII bacterium]|nr:hypothetical protein [Clostridiales Family XIII bacterium]
MKDFERINLMLTITHRGHRDKIIEGLRELGVTYNMATVGESMGGLSITDYLGLQDDELDVILSVVADSKADRAMAFIEYSSYSGTGDKGRAVAALIPISGVSGPLVLEYISGPGPG